jgi:hypothetical protein
MALIKKSEWAQRQGFSKAYISKLIKEGKITPSNGLIDEEQANHTLSCLREPGQPLRRKNNPQICDDDDLPTQFLKTKLKNEVERGKLLEAKVKSEVGQLISAEKVRNAMFAKGRIIRDGMMNIPDRVSALLATINDAAQIHEILSKEIRDVLEELSRD